MSGQTELAIMKQNVTNEAIIWVQGDLAPGSTCQTDCSNSVFNLTTTGLPTYDGTRTLHAVTAFLSTLHHNFEPHAQELDLTEQFGIPLTNGWATVALLQCHNQAAVWVNHPFAVHASAGVAWEDLSTPVKEAFIPPNAVTRLKHD